MALDPRELLKPWARNAGPDEAVPLAGNGEQRLQRVQVGVFGLGAMILMVALADIVTQRAQEAELSAVPEAAPTVAASETPAPRDPLADAGVVPEQPADPQPEPTPSASQETGDVQSLPQSRLE